MEVIKKNIEPIQYLENLNKCFGHWGDEKQYNWVFERKVGKQKTEQMLLSYEGSIIAGSGVSYRSLLLNGKEHIVGIMTGSWTLPEARGKGAFTQIINSSLEMVETNDLSLLTAFVVESNPSYRRLRDAGSELIPTHYFFGSKDLSLPPPPPGEIAEVDFSTEALKGLYQEYLAPLSCSLRFHYTEHDWLEQFINRPTKIKWLCWDDMNILVEEKGDIFRVQYLSVNSLEKTRSALIKLLEYGKKKNKNILVFTTQSVVIETCLELGMEDNPGFFTLLASNNKMDISALKANVLIHSGDRM